MEGLNEAKNIVQWGSKSTRVYGKRGSGFSPRFVGFSHMNNGAEDLSPQGLKT